MIQFGSDYHIVAGCKAKKVYSYKCPECHNMNYERKTLTDAPFENCVGIINCYLYKCSCSTYYWMHVDPQDENRVKNVPDLWD